MGVSGPCWVGAGSVHEKICLWIHAKICLWIHEKICLWIHAKICLWIRVSRSNCSFEGGFTRSPSQLHRADARVSRSNCSFEGGFVDPPSQLHRADPCGSMRRFVYP